MIGEGLEKTLQRSNSFPFDTKASDSLLKTKDSLHLFILEIPWSEFYIIRNLVGARTY